MDESEMEIAHPPPPWRLRGRAWLNVQLIPVARVKDGIPRSFDIVRVAPGRTIGGIYLAAYGPESTIEYHELIVFSALVRCGRKIGGWVSHIYVDSQESVAGGRAIWGLPKQLADFHWGEDVKVTCEGREVIRARNLRMGSGIRLRAPLPAFGIDIFAGHPLHFTGRCHGRVSRSTARFEIPTDSPLAPLGVGRGWSFSISELNAIIRAPDSLSPLG